MADRTPQTQWALPIPGHRSWLIELPTCDSTNTWALAHGEALTHGAVVWTRRQTAGRGRNGSRWLAPEGVLTATVVLHQPEPLPQLALTAGLAVCHAVEDLCPGLPPLRLKWPNDVLIGRVKLAGILCERSGPGERSDAIVAVGIGLNLDPRWDESPEGLRFALSGRPTSLAEHGPVPPAEALLDRLRRYLLEGAGLLQARGFAPLAEAWRTRDALSGATVAVSDGNRRTEGQAQGIDDQGRLRIATAAGEMVLTGGHVEAVE